MSDGDNTPRGDEILGKVMAALVRVESKLDVYGGAVTKIADDVLAIKAWQNRYRRRIRALEAESAGRHVDDPPSPPPMRAPSPSLNWEEDTGQHFLSPEELLRAKDLIDRDKRASSFWHDLPRDAFAKFAAILVTAGVAALFTYLVAHYH